jgi:hypothetical protein
MSIETYFRRDFPARATTAAVRDDQIETDLSRYRGAIPFWDNTPYTIARGSIQA